MIGSIRQLIQKRGAKVILWLTLLSLAGGSFITVFHFSRRFGNDAVGSVNDQEIGIMDYRRKYAETQHMVQEIKRMYGPQADMILSMWGIDKKPDEYALESLITDKVFQSAADSLGIHVSKEYVQTKLRDPFFVREFLSNVIPPQALSGGTLDVAVLKYALQRQGISEEQFEENVHEAMKRALLQRLIEGGVYVPRAAVRDAYAREYLKKKFATLRIPMGEYVRKVKQEKLSDEDIEKYFNAHKESYRIPEKRSARVWSFDPDSFGLTITDKDLESAYHKRKRSFIEKPEEYQLQHILFTFDAANPNAKIEARKKAQEILKQAKEKPETFEALAAKYSQSKDKGTAIALKRSATPGAFENTATSLQLKEISPVIETPQGFEIIKLVGKKEPVFKALSAVKDTLLKSLKQEKFAAEFNANAQRIISQASDLPELFTKFISERKGHESSATDVIADGTTRSERLFGLSKKGDKAFYQEEGKGYIGELTGITPSALPPLSSVREKVAQDIYNEKAQKAAEADVEAIRASIKDKKTSLKDAIRSLAFVKPDVNPDTGLIDTKSPEQVKVLTGMKMPVNKMEALTKVRAIVSEITPEQVSVAQLLEIEPFKQDDFDKKKAQLETQLRRQQSGMVQRGFSDALRARAKVTINQDLLRAAGR